MFPILIILITIVFLPAAYARTTPQDFVDAKKEAYQEKVTNYTPQNQQKLEDMSRKIASINKKITAELEQNTLRQGQVLDEYIRREGVEEKNGDGINRDLSDPVENARYWLTFAHEAISYQAAKIYIFNLSGEDRIRQDTAATINQLEADIDSLLPKVTKSQKIIKQLITQERRM